MLVRHPGVGVTVEVWCRVPGGCRLHQFSGVGVSLEVVM